VKQSIIIRAYNEGKRIGRLFAGIAQQTLKDTEIVLVDSGSTDATIDLATGYSFVDGSRVKIVHIKPDEFTFGYSLNQGIAASQNELVVIASAHVYPVYPDWLERLLSPFTNPKVALSYGKQRGNQLTNFSERQIFAHWFSDQSNTIQTQPFCNNANAAIRRSLWEQHPYDESLTGLEDLEWARWALSQGHALSYVAEAEVVHVHDESRGGVYNRYRREAMAFRRIFPEERFNLGSFFRLVFINIFNDVLNAAQQREPFPNLTGIFWFRWMQFWGTYQGFLHSGPVTQQLRRTFYYPGDTRSVSPNRARDVAPIRYYDVE
jgi:rhamnosyltransferase